jgi:hypothetical protein
MRSSYDSYNHSSSTSNSLGNSRYRSPSKYVDLNSLPSSGSDRAEFHDRYQNRVNRK